jgi:hypothetical protein
MGTLSVINAAVFDGVSDGLADGPVHVADGRIVSVGGLPGQPARSSTHAAARCCPA